MLEEDYSELLDKLLETCESDLAVPSEWEDRLSQRGIIEPIHDDRRSYIRHRFTRPGMLEFDETFSSIPRDHTLAKVVTRDVSRCGIAFLYSEQLYPGEQVSLWLPIGKRTYIVERCIQHNDNCFEIGATIAGIVPENSSC